MLGCQYENLFNARFLIKPQCQNKTELLLYKAPKTNVIQWSFITCWTIEHFEKLPSIKSASIFLGLKHKKPLPDNVYWVALMQSTTSQHRSPFIRGSPSKLVFLYSSTKWSTLLSSSGILHDIVMQLSATTHAATSISGALGTAERQEHRSVWRREG